MRYWNLTCLFVVALLCTGCKGTGVLRNFSVTKAGDGNGMDEEMPPMRLATDASAPHSRWNNPPETNANKNGSEASSSSATPARLAKSNGPKAEKTNLNGGLKPPAQLGDLPPAPAGAVATTKTSPMSEDLNTDELMEAFENAPPEVRGLANRYAAALNLRNQKGDETTAADKPAIELPDTPSKSNTATVAKAAGTPEKKSPEKKNPEQKHLASGEIQQAKGLPETPSSNNAAVAYLSDDDETSVQPTSASSPSSPSPAPPAAKPAEMKPVVASLETASTEALMKELATRLQPDADAPVDAQVRIAMRQRLLALIDQRNADAMKTIDGASPQEQQFMQAQMQALALLLDEQGTPQRSRRYTDALSHLKEAVSLLGAATGALEVHPPIFCTEVESFGCVTRFDKDRFKPGQQVILYCEVDRFVAEKVKDRYLTHLQGAYEIYDAAGTKVAEQTLPEDEQWCDHYRRDYFIAYRFYLPNHLTAGKYRLKLTMEDRKGKLFGQNEIGFEISP